MTDLLRSVSYGGGVQSTCLLVLAAQGEIDFRLFLFANVGDDSEHPSTLRYVREVAIPYAAEHGIELRELHRVPQRGVAKGHVETLWGRLTREGSRSLPIPVRMSNGAPGTRSCSVVCTFHWLIISLCVVIKERAVDLRQQLMEDRVAMPQIGSVAAVERLHPPFVVLDDGDGEVVVATEYLRDLALSDCSQLTCRSYAFALLRWFRLLWALDVGWDRATEAEVTVLVGWFRSAANPQRQRRPESPPAGSVNVRTGKPTLGAGYAPRTINHSLSVVSGFYEFHGHHGRGPVVNPVPESPQRRRALGHLSPLEPKPMVGRARLRQRVPDRPPRAIPDALWDELFDVMGNERDRALLEVAVSSGARAAELLGIRPEDIDWAGRQLFIVSKGTRRREPVPASPQAFIRIALYFDQIGVPPAGEPIWRALRGEDKRLSYWALRRVLQRANALLGTNWTWHDLRHTAAVRMANSDALTLPQVQAILRHADIQTTSRYLAVHVEDLFDQLAEYYARPRSEPTYSAGYDPEDIKAVFGG